MAATTVRWRAVREPGFWRSLEGRFEIEPVRPNARACVLSDGLDRNADGSWQTSMHDTAREAKLAAQKIVDNMIAEG